MTWRHGSCVTGRGPFSWQCVQAPCRSPFTSHTPHPRTPQMHSPLLISLHPLHTSKAGKTTAEQQPKCLTPMPFCGSTLIACSLARLSLLPRLGGYQPLLISITPRLYPSQKLQWFRAGVHAGPPSMAARPPPRLTRAAPRAIKAVRRTPQNAPAKLPCQLEQVSRQAGTRGASLATGLHGVASACAELAREPGPLTSNAVQSLRQNWARQSPYKQSVRQPLRC